jgi:hypothetical protein
MRKEKKDFFYNPSWRVSVNIIAGLFLVCFKLFQLIWPKLESLVTQFEAGRNKPAAIIGFMSGAIITPVILLFPFKVLTWSFQALVTILIIYVLVSLMGYISLMRYRDYQQENR